MQMHKKLGVWALGLVLLVAALVAGGGGACKEIEPTGHDADTHFDTGVSKDTATDSGPTGRDSTPATDAETGLDADSGSSDTAQSGPGACCTRDGCIYVDAKANCPSLTYFAGFECSSVQCGSADF